MVDFAAQAQALRDELIARRRDIHAHPELGFEETRTAGIVAGELQRLGIEIRTGVGKTGVVGLLEGAQDGPTVLVRADMDALPIQEDTGLPYASTVPGKMHACGHDGHTSIALGVAKLLAAQRDRMAGRVKFIFQPAEEITSGARSMIADGALTDPRPDVSLGLHLWNDMPRGKIGIGSGPVMAGASIFIVQITGKGAHGASPHQGVDPVYCAAQLVTAYQSIVSRNLDPFDTAVISVTQVHAGDAFNVIPQTAELRGTIRTFRTEVRDLIEQRMNAITEQLSAALGCTATVEIRHGTNPVANDETVAARLRAAFAPILGEDALDTSIRTMGAEDMGEFMTDIPGTYFFLGAKDMTQATYYGHHHPRFSFDEEALPLGVQLLTTAVASYVLPEG